ncbi:restriction endonuclease subunit S [Dysosmobacter segnis]|uniref:Restriction endonuclease subunit S n=1 Tax=Dysosmobacter segnis TaxID=2763042 RepID=A0A923MKI7_9FIRM|nr:restriction endonuclease subunit S [Dysosmobacter segnis]MBC5771386.1 restriction endonuclease subunit S [Dysosmobacter segnis]
MGRRKINDCERGSEAPQVLYSPLSYGDNLHYEKFADDSVKCIEDEIPFELPDGWAWERLSNLASFSGGKTPSTSRSEYWDGDILWVTSKDMKSKYITSSQLRLSTLGAEQMQMYQPDTLLLVTRSGILRHTLPVAILKECATINQDLKAIILYMPQLAEYIYVCLKGMETQLLLKYTKSGTTVENVNFDEFQKVLLPIPPIQQIDRIMSSTGSAESVVSTIEDDKAALADYVIKAKSKILDLAIRGQLVPQDPDDEPASVLLERIRAEKEELIKQGKIKRDKKESVIFRGEDNSYYEKMGGKVVNIDDEIPFELPESWAWCRGYSCFEGLGSTKPQGDFFDYIDIDAIDNRLHCIKDAKHLPVSDAPSRASRAVKDGSVLFSLVRPYLENIAFVEEKHSNCIASTGFYVCNSNGVLLPEFMFFLMISGYVVNGLNQYMKGDNSPSISKDNIENWLYPVPPIGEQQTICAKLKTVFTLVENVEKSLN